MVQAARGLELFQPLGVALNQVGGVVAALADHGQPVARFKGFNGAFAPRGSLTVHAASIPGRSERPAPYSGGLAGAAYQFSGGTILGFSVSET